MRYSSILIVPLLALGMGCASDEEALLTVDPPRNPRRGIDAGLQEPTPPTPDAGPDDTDPWVNGCQRAGSEDFTGQAEVAITFGYTVGADYLPRCLRVDRGTLVTFAGPFADDPLVGGEIEGMTEFPDPNSPFGNVDRGDVITFVMDVEPGAYGFYSQTRGTTHGMAGAIWVQ